MMISHIVAAAKNGTIGADGGLPWDIPEDMKFLEILLRAKRLLWVERLLSLLDILFPNA